MWINLIVCLSGWVFSGFVWGWFFGYRYAEKRREGEMPEDLRRHFWGQQTFGRRLEE